MATLLTEDRRFWPVDKVILAYLGFALALILGWWSRLADPAILLGGHLLAAALLVYQVRRPNPTSSFFHHWYPLVYVAACYKTMAIFIPAVRHSDADQWLADLDFAFWHAHPTVWLERIQTPALSEYLQIIYTLFVPAVLIPAFILWRKRRYKEFQYYAFLIALGYLVSYAGYLMVPARGPRFLLSHLQHVPLRGLWLFDGMQNMLDKLESAHFDCFPSGHTELTILAWWGTRQIANPLFWPYFVYTLSIIFATVYLRYHYTIDVLAGVLVATTLLWATPFLYRKLK